MRNSAGGLTEKVFFYIFRIKENAGNIFLRVSDRASYLMGKYPHGDFCQSVHCESNEIHSRKLLRIPGLYHSVYPGIREGSVIQKTDLRSLKTDMQYFITDRPPKAWNAQSVLNRILLHRDTGTGVSGIRDNTFREDKVRYRSVNGAMSHVSLLSFAWNCLSAPVFKRYRMGESMSCKIQFRKDHPEYNPLKL